MQDQREWLETMTDYYIMNEARVSTSTRWDLGTSGGRSGRARCK